MKSIITLVALTVVLALAVTGCGEKTSGKTDVKALEKAFSGAEPAYKDVINKAVTAINAANYQEAFGELMKLNNNENLTTEQRQAVADAMHELAHLLPPPNPGGGRIAPPAP